MNTIPTNQSLFDRLFAVADDQAGYFTTLQARGAGFSPRQLSYYVETGRIQRVTRGVYRLTQYPASAHEDLFAASLVLGPHATLSHETALVIYGLSDVLPSVIHATVPRTASRRQPHLRLHTKHLPAEHVTRYGGLPVTTVARTLADVAEGGLADDLVIQAIDEALRRGLTTRDRLQALARTRSGRFARLVSRTIGPAT